VAGVY
jgi:group I intron endonuclease